MGLRLITVSTLGKQYLLAGLIILGKIESHASWSWGCAAS